ncbi:Ku protein [Streptomyces avermitilis]
MTEDHSVRFRRIHTADRGLVRNRYWCEEEDREVTFGETGLGYELPDGRVIPVTDEELRALPLPTARAIELIAFIPAAAVDPLRIGPATTSSRKALSPPSRTWSSATPWSAPHGSRSRGTRGTAVNGSVCCGSGEM